MTSYVWNVESGLDELLWLEDGCCNCLAPPSLQQASCKRPMSKVGMSANTANGGHSYEVVQPPQDADG